jgi:hypothetical protein
MAYRSFFRFVPENRRRPDEMFVWRLVLREFDAQPVEAHRVNEIIAETAALIANLDLVISVDSSARLAKYCAPCPRGRDSHCRPRGQNRNQTPGLRHRSCT